MDTTRFKYAVLLKHTSYSIRIVSTTGDYHSPAIRGLGRHIPMNKAGDYFLSEQIPKNTTEVIAVNKEIPYAPDDT